MGPAAACLRLGVAEAGDGHFGADVGLDARIGHARRAHGDQDAVVAVIDDEDDVAFVDVVAKGVVDDSAKGDVPEVDFTGKDVVSGDRLTGTLTLGQFVKAVSSFLAPIIASAFAGTVFGWKWIFPIFAVVSLIAAVWLFLAPIRQEEVAPVADLSFGAAFSLLKDKYIRLFFIGILVLVGADVGMGISLPKVLNERFGWVESKATLGNSLYFLARTVSAFCGGILLMKLREDKFYVVSLFVALAGLAGIVFSHSYVLMVISVVLFGFGYANLFSILFSLSLKHMPLKSNEVSALLVTGIAGGGLVAPVLGIVTDILHTQTAAFAALLLIWVYMFLIIKPVSRISDGGR